MGGWGLENKRMLQKTKTIDDTKLLFAKSVDQINLTVL